MMILMVSRFRKVAAVVVEPTLMPRKMVMMFISSLFAAFARRSITPDSFMRLPSIRQPTSGTVDGRSSAQSTVQRIGKMIFSLFETMRSVSILIRRSLLVVRARMIGGWMIGTSAM